MSKAARTPKAPPKENPVTHILAPLNKALKV